MKTKISKTAGVLTLAIAAAGATTVQAQTTVRLNGQPLATSVPPTTIKGHTMVPMRDIFEALGASVNYNSLTRGIIAKRANTNISLQIGNRSAVVNGRTIMLEQAPMIDDGSTLVPLRFVSENLGANVRYNAQRRIVNIRTDGKANGNNGGTQVAGVRTLNVPAGSVVPVTLDSELSSKTARVGDTFTATVRSQRLGDSEFPAGTKIEGVVVEASAHSGSEPGVLDLDFRNVLLPDGTRHAIRGELIGLDDNSVQTINQGRIVAKNTAGGKNDKLKVIGIGAGAGYLLGKVLLKKDGVLSAVLGAAGGYLYSQQKDKSKARDAMLPAGAQLGVKLNSALTYADTTEYYNDRVRYINE